MIVTDLDGTLLNRERKLPRITEEYLISLKEKGYIVVIATGRNFVSAKKHTNGAKFANYLISDGGSCTYIPDTEEALFKNVIPKKTIEKILSLWSDDFEYLQLCDKNSYIKYRGENAREFLSSPEDIVHISIKMKDNELTEKLFQNLERQFSNLEVLLMQDSFKEDKSVELVPKGISKYSAIHKLADYLDISNDEIIAFGDSPNDIDMLENCGFGVAMKNALKEVKEKATAVTIKDYNEFGVVEFLKNIIERW